MSTNIHSGYKILRSDLQGIFDLCNELAPAIYQKAEDGIAQEIYRRAALKFDLMTLGEQPVEKFWDSARSEVVKEIGESRSRRHRHPDTDYSCSVTFFPVREFVVALFQSEHEELEAIWAAHPDVEHFPYWNSTDKPDEISDVEWEFRSSMWDEALKVRAPYGSNSGLTHTFVEEWYVPVWFNRDLPEIPLNERARAVAEQLHQGDTTGFHSGFAYVASQTYRDRIKDEAKAIEPRLNPVINRKMLT